MQILQNKSQKYNTLQQKSLSVLTIVVTKAAILTSTEPKKMAPWNKGKHDRELGELYEPLSIIIEQLLVSRLNYKH